MKIETENPLEPNDAKPPGKDKQSLELLFILIVGVIVMAAAIVSLTYNPTSARAPLVVLAPLLLLIGIQINRSRKQVGFADIARTLSESLKGHRPVVIKAIALIGWMIFLLGVIFLAGHYAGILLFMFVLLRFKAGESWRVSILVTLAVTAVIFGLFEQIFNIELYRGIIFRIL